MTVRLTPFNKILIVNRGEIALRVMRAARAMGYRSVAVVSNADTDAVHVRAADQAVCIGGALPVESYLRIDSIIAEAKTTGFYLKNAALPFGLPSTAPINATR